MDPKQESVELFKAFTKQELQQRVSMQIIYCTCWQQNLGE